MFTTEHRTKSCRLMKHHSGFTLIELIIFIVVVSAGLAGILSVMNTTIKSSADPMVRKQAAAVAESVLEEILQKEYSNPTGGYTGTPDRTLADDVDDYKSLTSSQIQAIFSDTLAQVPGYSIAIVVGDPTAVLGIAMKKVTVSVSRGAETVVLTGYRSYY